MNDTIKIVDSNKAPEPGPDCKCGLQDRVTYSGLPSHYVRKNEYSNYDWLVPCFQKYNFAFPMVVSDITTVFNTDLKMKVLKELRPGAFSNRIYPTEYDNVGYVWWGKGKFNNSK